MGAASTQERQRPRRNRAGGSGGRRRGADGPARYRPRIFEFAPRWEAMAFGGRGEILGPAIPYMEYEGVRRIAPANVRFQGAAPFRWACAAAPRRRVGQATLEASVRRRILRRRRPTPSSGGRPDQRNGVLEPESRSRLPATRKRPSAVEGRLPHGPWHGAPGRFG